MAILKELWSKDSADPSVKSTCEHVVYLQHRLEAVSDFARSNLQKAARKKKLQYDRTAKHRKIQVGDNVLILLPKKVNKLLL